jgi:hypothetical protein
MSSRKQTPDVLGAILGGAEPAETPEQAAPPQSASQPRKATKAEAAAPIAPTKAPPKAAQARPAVVDATPVEWEYLEVVFRDYRGWRPRMVNGRESGGWKNAPVIIDYLKQLGSEGWELVSIGDPHHNEKEAYLKRLKRNATP